MKTIWVAQRRSAVDTTEDGQQQRKMHRFLRVAANGQI